MDGIIAQFSLKKGQFNLEVNFQLPEQGVTAIFGPSGSGKTTLIRCIAGLERTLTGFLSINNQCWQDDNRSFFLAAHQRPLGYVFQEANLFPHLTVEKNLRYGWQRTPKEQRKLTLEEVSELLGVTRLLKRSPIHLSGGERQRVAMARALLTSPQLLLMDEPLAALDNQSKMEILPYLEKLHTELSIPILYITHSLTEVMRLADHILVIEQGKLLGSGQLSTVLTQLDLPFTKTEEAGVVIEAKVVEHDDYFHLTYLDFMQERITTHKLNIPIGQTIRVSIKARDVSLSLTSECNSSILNMFQTTIIQLSEEEQGFLMVKLDFKGNPLLARITRKSGHLLNLCIGMSVFVRVKSVALL